MEQLQQSDIYCQYVRALGWQVDQVDGVNIFRKNFPLWGGLAKMQRFNVLPEKTHLADYIKKYRIRQVVIEPEAGFPQEQLDDFTGFLAGQRIGISNSPYIPTKTIRIDLLRPADQIFTGFTEAKRRAVRRATKLEVRIKQTSDIEQLIRIKNKSAGFLGFITTYGIAKMRTIFGEKQSAILLAELERGRTVGGVFLIFHKQTAFYWIAGATREGKKLFAPTLLVWEALKLAKSQGCRVFDFVGVWDERLPSQNTEWKGFTKFKEGFGGKELYYPISFIRKS